MPVQPLHVTGREVSGSVVRVGKRERERERHKKALHRGGCRKEVLLNPNSEEGVVGTSSDTSLLLTAGDSRRSQGCPSFEVVLKGCTTVQGVHASTWGMPGGKGGVKPASRGEKPIRLERAWLETETKEGRCGCKGHLCGHGALVLSVFVLSIAE